MGSLKIQASPTTVSGDGAIRDLENGVVVFHISASAATLRVPQFIECNKTVLGSDGSIYEFQLIYEIGEEGSMCNRASQALQVRKDGVIVASAACTDDAVEYVCGFRCFIV